MNLAQIVEYLNNKKILKKNLSDKINEIRILRNEQHIGTHKNVKHYAKSDLEYAFSVAREVKIFASKKCK